MAEAHGKQCFRVRLSITGKQARYAVALLNCKMSILVRNPHPTVQTQTEKHLWTSEKRALHCGAGLSLHAAQHLIICPQIC